MFTSEPPTCTGRTLDLPRKDRDIRYLRPLGNSDIALNRIVKIVKNRASGYRHLDHFADMIYLTVGDLDIPAHVPSQLRTL